MKTRALWKASVLALVLTACGQPLAAPPVTSETTEAPPVAVAPMETAVPANAPEPRATTELTPAFEPTFEQAACPLPLPSDVKQGEDVLCGFVTVPEDHSNPAGPTIRLSVIVVRDDSEEHHPDPLIFLHGGPGGGVIRRASSIVPLLQPAFGNRDVILFDQRGVGTSEPALECPEWNQNFLDTLDEADLDARARTGYDAFIACRDRFVSEGVHLAAYNTTQSAADVQAIRVALGYDEVNLYGSSYGSLLAQAVMRDHPDSIRSVIIDSVLPVEKSLFIEGSVTVAKDIQRLLDACEADDKCRTANPDLNQMLYDVIEQLNANPALITVRNPVDGKEYEMMLTGEAVLSNLGGWLYQTSVIPLLPKTIHDLRNGDYRLMEQLAGINLAMMNLITRGVMLSVMCQDDLTGRTLDDLLDVREGLPDALVSAVSEDILLEYGVFSLCEAWPVEAGDPAFKEPVVSDIPTLVLSGEFDPVTPPEYGRLVAKHLSNSFHYELPGVGHGALGSTECSFSIAAAFLDDPSTEPDGSCIADLGLEFILTTELAELDLEQVTFDTFGIAALAPENWTRVNDEYWVSPDQAIELVIKEQRDGDERIFLEQWGAADVWREVEANGRPWAVYDIEDRDELGRYYGYIATSPSEEGFYLILIVGSSEDQLPEFYEYVVTPIMETFEVLDVPAGENETQPPENGHEAEEITLEPYTSDSFGISGVVPAGWQEAVPGTFTRGTPPQDVTIMVQKSYDGLSRDDLLARLLPSLGITELPTMAGTREANGFAWELYVVSVEAPGVGTIVVDVALTVAEMPYLVLLQVLEEEAEALHEMVFLPAVDALVPTE